MKLYFCFRTSNVWKRYILPATVGKEMTHPYAYDIVTNVGTTFVEFGNNWIKTKE